MMAFVYALVLSAVLCFLFRRVGLELDLVDRPSGTLKPHEKPISYVGGTAILLALVPWLIQSPEFFPAIIIMWALGFADDIRSISPKIRLTVEVLVGFAVAFIIYGFSTVDSIILSIIFAGTVNAYNMVDGLDGICSTNMIVFGVFAFFTGFVPLMSLAVAGVYAGYLIFNFPPARLFMGDQGSYIAGTFVGTLLIQSWGSQNFVRIAAICWPVVLDLFVGFLRRSIAKKSPFAGDRDHYYDKIFKLSGNRKKVTLLISTGIALSYAFVGAFIPVIFIPPVLLAASLVQIFSLGSLHSTT
ncbi:MULTISPECIES: glycosyltransferase family 4 protein [unclassified Mesotoga]|uniref:glycosyltransferase family 4 protein n=1 Tax=unclassified Mesotoga TaxID=1184398 RepID=UPI000DA65AAC|nr:MULTISPECIES: MraY family glycosyltransferase [unclassified Mesotoga]PZC52041.1 UDP-N-acetylmuramyl pentapeptide phosphotransferase [Mesotoga sp. TolDC]